MTTRVFLRSRVVGLRAGLPVLCSAALALLAPRAYAQDAEFRSTLTIAAGPTLPTGARHPFDNTGSMYFAAVAVGDDFSTVGLSLGYSVFGAGPFEDRGASVTQFELRADCAPLAPHKISPYVRLGAGAYGVDPDRSKFGPTSRLVGIATGVGIRWSPRWRWAATLVASYHFVPSRSTPTRHWAGLTLELMRWMD